jgi:hypothetical protein
MDQKTDRRDSAIAADDSNQHLVFHERNCISESYSSDDSEISHSPSLSSLKRPYYLSRSDGFPDVLRIDKFTPTPHSKSYQNKDRHPPIKQPEKEKGTQTVSCKMAATGRNNIPQCRYGDRRKLTHRNDDVENKVCWFHGSRRGKDKKDQQCQK